MAGITALALPGGLKFNTNEIPANTTKHQFTRVRDGHKKVSYVSLSGAPQMWKKAAPEYNTTIYILRVPASLFTTGASGEQEIRIAGTPQDVQRALLAVLNSQNLVDEVMKYAITSQNYQTVAKQVYDQEVAAREAYKKAQNEHKVKPYTLEQIKFYGSSENVKQAIINQGSSSHPGFGPRRSQDIRTKLASILPGGSDFNPNDLKSIDVTTMDINTGHGAKKAKRPAANGTSKKIHNDAAFPGIMSADFEHYYAAVNMLYPEIVASPQGQQLLAHLQQMYLAQVQQEQARVASLSGNGRVLVPPAWSTQQVAQPQVMGMGAPNATGFGPTTLPGASFVPIGTLVPQQ